MCTIVRTTSFVPHTVSEFRRVHTRYLCHRCGTTDGARSLPRCPRTLRYYTVHTHIHIYIILRRAGVGVSYIHYFMIIIICVCNLLLFNSIRDREETRLDMCTISRRYAKRIKKNIKAPRESAPHITLYFYYTPPHPLCLPELRNTTHVCIYIYRRPITYI